MSTPPHHTADGRFRNPWAVATEDDAVRGQIFKVAREWIGETHPPDPSPDQLPTASWKRAREPVSDNEVRITWAGHASFLIELPGANLLTDPIWSPRASPVPWIGSRRFVPAVPDFDDLPEIHGVLLSHDHYDHLDRPTVLRLRDRFGDALEWYTPLGYRSWFGRLGVRRVTELDWWDSVDGPGGHRLTAAPARHWTRRTVTSTNRRLWSSWVVAPGSRPAPAPSTPRVYFGGDSAYAPHFREVADRLGPFDASLLPIGAYEPRWFMKSSHMNPEEAVQAYLDLGSAGDFIPSHWGTFRLTFEDPLEPPERTRAAWTEAGLEADRLRIPRHGETLVVRR